MYNTVTEIRLKNLEFWRQICKDICLLENSNDLWDIFGMFTSFWNQGELDVAERDSQFQQRNDAYVTKDSSSQAT